MNVVEVKLADTAEAVTRVIAEKTAGCDAGGAVDLVWINGPNFASMKENHLLFGPFAEALPNFRYVDTQAKPILRSDFTIATEGFEAPWNLAQIVFYGEGAALSSSRDRPWRFSTGRRPIRGVSPIRNRPISSARPF